MKIGIAKLKEFANNSIVRTPFGTGLDSGRFMQQIDFEARHNGVAPGYVVMLNKNDNCFELKPKNEV